MRHFRYIYIRSSFNATSFCLRSKIVNQSGHKGYCKCDTINDPVPLIHACHDLYWHLIEQFAAHDKAKYHLRLLNLVGSFCPIVLLVSSA